MSSHPPASYTCDCCADESCGVDAHGVGRRRVCVDDNFLGRILVKVGLEGRVGQAGNPSSRTGVGPAPGHGRQVELDVIGSNDL